MNISVTRLCRTAVIGSTLLPAFTLAGGSGSITFSPVAPISVPTMGGIGLLLLAAIVGFVAIQSLRKGGAHNRMASLLAVGLGFGALLSAVGGVNLISESRAIVVINPDQVITNPAGETLDIFQGTVNTYENASGIQMKVTDIQLPVCGVGLLHSDSTLCDLDLVIDDGNSCELPCFFLESDRRLKTDISEVGTASNGLPLYNFRYIGDDVLYRGVMAQDVLAHTPSAVMTMPDGFMAVNYSALGLEMTRVE